MATKRTTTITSDSNEEEDKYFTDVWTVWSHSMADDNWSVSGYNEIFKIASLTEFWQFFNHMHLLRRTDHSFFIMRDKIKPVWEANANREGGIISFKVDDTSRAGDTDMGVLCMTCVSLLVLNESFLETNEINGVSYTIKTGATFIKVWYKHYAENIHEYIPMSLFQSLTKLLKVKNADRKKRGRVPIQVKYSRIEPTSEEIA